MRRPHRTREGYQWTPSEGLSAGAPCIGVIQPAQKIRSSGTVYDAIVIGAGYAGLTAARDLSISGLEVLLLEGRDRIGGRTWSSEVEGYPYEMGGTWIHWYQPHTYREISRYGMENELEHSADYTKQHNFFTWGTVKGQRNMSHEEEEALFTRALSKFMNIDGQLGKVVMPFPFNSNWNKSVEEYAHLSVADRICQIQHDLTSDEQAAIESFVLLCSGGTRENSSFLDFLRWWAAGGYNYASVLETTIGFKLRCGQSRFAIRFFDEALASGHLSYSFDSTVSHVDSRRELTCVQTKRGDKFRARRIVCTAPLNVLQKISFSPSLDPMKLQASTMQHVNKILKLHAEVRDPGLRSWSGMIYPDNQLVLGVGDGTTPAGNTHCVFFGLPASPLVPEDDIDGAVSAIQKFLPMDIERLLFHNWSKDEFSEGAWVWYRPNMELQYLEALRKRHGAVLFANSDWASGGWRSFIDGAIQSGAEAAVTIRDELFGQRGASRL